MQELICREDAQQSAFVSALAALTQVSAVRACVPDINGTLLGCIKCYGERSIAQNGYMNLMYN